MDFINSYGAVIDLPKSTTTITFSTKKAIAESITDRHDTALRIVDDNVTLPAHTSVLIDVASDALVDYEGIAEGNIRLLLDNGKCIARGFVHLQNGCIPILLTNFTNERRHLAKGTTVGFIETIAELTHLTMLGTTSDESPAPDIHIPLEFDQKFSTTEKDALIRLVREFSD